MTISDHNQPDFHNESESFYTKFLQAELTARIGGDLRGFYGEMTAAPSPDHLVDLASRIDAKRWLGEGEA